MLETRIASISRPIAGDGFAGQNQIDRRAEAGVPHQPGDVVPAHRDLVRLDPRDCAGPDRFLVGVAHEALSVRCP